MSIEKSKRFEIVLPAVQKQGLANLAAELGVNSATVAKLAINLKAAKAIGLIVPPSLLASANAVIE